MNLQKGSFFGTAAASFITLARAKTGNLALSEFKFVKGQISWNTSLQEKVPFANLTLFKELNSYLGIFLGVKS